MLNKNEKQNNAISVKNVSKQFVYLILNEIIRK